MKNKRFSGYIIGGILVLLGIFCITVFNKLVKKEEQVKLTWNEVQNAYQRRLDLIPNLVNVVKGGADFEQGTLEKISTARARALSVGTDLSANNFQQQTAAQDELAGTVNRLMITVEKYPDLQGARAFSDLQTQLEGSERRIKVARKDFNAAIADYNSSVKSFPTSLLAGIFGFKAKDGFTADSGADKAVPINFNK